MWYSYYACILSADITGIFIKFRNSGYEPDASLQNRVLNNYVKYRSEQYIERVRSLRERLDSQGCVSYCYVVTIIPRLNVFRILLSQHFLTAGDLRINWTVQCFIIIIIL